MSNRKLTTPHCPHCGKPIAAPRKPAADGMTAEQFHDARNAACAAIAAEHGARWDRVPGASAWCTIPSRLRTFTTARGTRIRCRADARLPAARYWPGGALPAGVVVTASDAGLSPAALHRRAAERSAASRDAAREFALIAFRARRRPEFDRWKFECRQHETARLAAISYAERLEQAAPPVTEPAAPVTEPAAPVTELEPGVYIRPGYGFSCGATMQDFSRAPSDGAPMPLELAPSEHATPGYVIGYIAGQPDSPLGFLRAARVRVMIKHECLLTIAAPAPAEPEPVTEPAAPATEPEPAGAGLAAVWQTAVDAWRAYRTPDDAEHLAAFQTALHALRGKLIDPGRELAIRKRCKAGHDFPAAWFHP